MKAAAPLQLREAGQSLWLDNISRDLLTSGTLQRVVYINRAGNESGLFQVGL